jgi:hypothetical protein
VTVTSRCKRKCVKKEWVCVCSTHGAWIQSSALPKIYHWKFMMR